MSEQTASVLARAADLTAAGDAASAIRLLRGLLDIEDANAEVWCRLAAAQLEIEEPTAALRSAGQALRRTTAADRTGQAWAHRLRSLALVELGRRGEAISAAREAVRTEPRNWRTHITLADCLLTDERTVADALRAAQQAVRLAPEHSRPYEVLGEAAERFGDPEGAEDAYQTARALDPQSELAIEGLTRLRADQPPPRAPDRPARVAQSLPPGPRADTHRAFGGLLRRLGAWLAGGSMLLMLAGMPNPTRLLAWFGLGLLLVCLLVAGGALRAFPGVSRWRPKYWWQGSVLLMIGAGTLAGALLLLASWTTLLALDLAATRLLTLALCCAAATGVIGYLTGPHRTRRSGRKG
ncbi:hypothetical protein EV191_113125 [Tamaricihabitans halophyticus]|uniref:Uncharacterized protein n=1 Tax=Tamaricihabitans halophyticus TaxID=1262583 RepID=A0A4V2SSI0_9PSEU|nr:tetratricopeptide repeat protein [Tamaricihabitans halophyticus]TCP46846.1 hypothetical protein EV191_113125 [Tamaricihabitans halophyticus]